MSRIATIAVASVSLVLAACVDSATKVTAPTSASTSMSPSAASFDAGGNASPDIRHMLPPRAQQTQDDHGNQDAGKNAGGGSGTGIYFHGGPVLQGGTKVATVYWANSAIYSGGPTPGSAGAGSADGSLIGAFLRGLGGSPYFNINSTYTDASGAHIANSVAYTQYWANNQYGVPSNGQKVTDAQMVAMLQYGFDHGYLSYDAGTLYHIFSAGTVNLGGGFGTQYCAYHTHGTVTVGGVARTVLYSAMPYDIAYPSACSANLSVWPNNDPGADAEVNTLAHETEETTTDMMGSAWYDRRGYENADKCAWMWGTTFTTSNGSTANVVIGGRNWLVQMNWVNSGSGGCLNKL